ncbi:MAG TPA: DHA2 family efflux MFS transporter permease subunit [Xanthobacteraceae bacterium]|nr:DHA2 family efflux MFS transporter permease subunit [Xanthobacteraceae bacterium]
MNAAAPGGAPAARRALLTVCAMTATVMQAIDSTIANVALPYMQASLSATLDQISWVLTSYIVAAAIMTTPVGWLSDRFGRKKLFVICASGFTIASALCALAQNIEQIVMFRLMQGVFGAALVPLSQAVMLDIYPAHQRAQAMSIWGMGVTLGPIMGPTLGGYLTDYFSWHWVFLINLPIGLVTVFGLLAFMDETRPRENLRFDWFGFLALALGIGAFQLMLDRGEQVGWFSATETWIAATASCVGFYYFFAHSLTTDEPFVRFAIFTDKNYVIGCVFMVVVGVVLFSTMALIVPFLQNLQGYPLTTTGIVLGSRGCGTLIAMLALSRIMRYIEARTCVLIGLALTAWMLHEMVYFNANTSQQTIFVTGTIQGFGLGFIFMPLATVAFTTLPSHLRTDGTAIFTLIRNISSSIGISIVIANLSRTTTEMHAYLSAFISPFNDALRAPDVARTLDLSTDTGRALADQLLTQQAAYIAYSNDFALLMWLTIASMPFVFGIAKMHGASSPRAGGAAAAAH